jgi:hypothetical protein
MGVGLHGDLHRNVKMSGETKDILGIIHERTPYSSWRCPRTVDYLKRELPQLGDHTLMTGCPVIYDAPILESSRFHRGEEVIAVTATEREDFWHRETRTIDFVAHNYPNAKRYFVVHQDYPARRKPKLMDRMFGAWRRSPIGLQHYAVARGFEVIRPASHDAAILLYGKVDMHFGSRLHAHLHMLSQNKRSFLTKVDERSTGIAEHYGFPLCDPTQFPHRNEFDFEVVRQAVLRTFPIMQKFVDSIGR